MHKFITLFIVLGALAPLSFAQNESLLIGPGDMLHIQVFDTPEMEQHARVTDSGTVPVEFIGELKLAGERPADAARAIETALIEKKVMQHPQVTVAIEQYGTQSVSVLGQVQTPGAYPITTPQSILKLISMAGGLTDLADRTITIERHGDSSKKVTYYLANDPDKALAAEAMVDPGDTVLVPKVGLIYVLGDVAKPGGYPITMNDSQMTLLQAIAMAGSANKTAVQSHIRLIRKTPDGQEEKIVQLSAVEKGKQPDIRLQPNDVLYIPFSWMKNVAVSAAGIVSSTSAAAIYTR